MTSGPSGPQLNPQQVRNPQCAVGAAVSARAARLEAASRLLDTGRRPRLSRPRQRTALPPLPGHMQHPHGFRPALFQSFWMGGFESSCHITRKGERLDMLAATQHDRFVDEDYALLRAERLTTIRDTVRWHRIERVPGEFDFSSLEPYVRAARRHNMEVIWDLLHYGWPDDLDIFSPAFVDRFARFAEATARYLRSRIDGVPFYTPINEISFFAWAAGQVGWFHPFAHGRGGELKRQLVRAWIAAVDAIRSVDDRARIVSVEPL